MFKKTVMSQTCLHFKGLATVIMTVATLIGFAGLASAQIVISAPQNTPVILPDDGTVTVTNTGSITVDPGIFAIDSDGNDSEFTLFGPVSATSNVLGDTVNTILQEGGNFNILHVHQGGDISASDDGNASVLRGVRQFGLSVDNTITLENARISSMSTGAEAFGIQQLTGQGRNNVHFGSNGHIEVLGGFTAEGINQTNLALDGTNTSVFGVDTRITVNALAGSAKAIYQAATDRVTSVFGPNARINAQGFFDAIAVEQAVNLGSASTTFGTNAHISVSGGDDAFGVTQRSPDNMFVLGQSSIINVAAGNDGHGLQQLPFGFANINQTIIEVNSRIIVTAVGTAVGIESLTSATDPSFLTLEHGAEVSASGNIARGVNVFANNFEMLNRGRIFASSTNAMLNSIGVRMNGDGNNFENHGSVFADLAPGSHAILMNGDNNMLSLLTYPVIQGQITFGNGGGVFGSGNTLLVGNGFDAAFTVGADPSQLTVLGQGQSLSVNLLGPNQLKVVSISSADFFRASSVRMTDDLIRFLQQEITTRGLKNRQFLNQENGLIQDFWFDASGFGQHSTTGRAYSHALGAFTVGYDRAFEDNGLGGIYAGYSIGSVNQGNAYWDNTLQTAYAGIYYDRAFDRILTGINLLGGINWDDVSRKYLDNTVLGGIVNGSDNGVGFLISPEVTVGYEVPYGSHLFIPSIAVRYSLFHQDSYSEGGANGLNLSGRDHQQVNVRLQVAGLGFSALNQDATRWSTTLRGGLDIYANWGDDINAQVMGFDVPYDENLNDAGVRPFVGADVQYLVTDRASLDFGVEAAYDSIDAVFGSINAGFSVLF